MSKMRWKEVSLICEPGFSAAQSSPAQPNENTAAMRGGKGRLMVNIWTGSFAGGRGICCRKSLESARRGRRQREAEKWGQKDAESGVCREWQLRIARREAT